MFGEVCGAPVKRMQMWYLIELQVVEVPCTGTIEEAAAMFDKGEFVESEITHKTYKIMRRHAEIAGLIKQLHREQSKKKLPLLPARKTEAVEESKGLVKKDIPWPGMVSKSARVGVVNEKLVEHKLIAPTGKDFEFWFRSTMADTAIQNTNAWQHFLKTDEELEMERVLNAKKCCTLQ